MTSVAFLMVMRGPALHDVVFVARSARARDRAVARLRARRLDCALADGAPPEATAPLALRARRLTALCMRRSIADTYRRLVREAHEGGASGHARLIPSAGRVIAATDELTRLADRLSTPGPVGAQGVAEALLLLSDGTGPLYNPRSDGTLRASAARAVRDLTLRTP